MNPYVRFTLVLTAVCVGAAVGVGGVYIITQAPIAKKQRMTEDLLRREVLPGANFFAAVTDEKGADSGVCAGYDREGGAKLGYAAKGVSKGYGGELIVMVGMDTGLAVTKAAVLLQRETPGLGAELGKIKTKDTLWSVLAGSASGKGESWMDQFKGKRKEQLKIRGGIDAKTGCTITSAAIVTAARNAVEKVERALATPVAANAGDTP
jgi:electron transport complex protein RnfG